jgi:hypothetical protein
MAISYLKSCCDSSVTFILTGLSPSLPLGNVYYAQIPNYFTGCSQVVSAVLPGAPTYTSAGSTLTNFGSCATCITSNPCIRITATSECDVVTKFPMGIECSPNITASTITINVTGGTPPYKIVWANGFQGPVLTNAVPGVSYSVTVTDYSWPNGGPDYTATTVCTLTPPTPTPTVTPSPTPSSGGLNTTFLCLQVTIGNRTYTYNFTPSNTRINNKFTWIYGPYVLSWQTSQGTSFWQVQMPIGDGVNPVILRNSSNTSVPLGSFIAFGSPGTTSVMTNGVCGNPIMTLQNATITPPTCQSTPLTGSIFVNILNGQSPVTYSKDGGLTTQSSPLFSNLPAGSYTITVQDGNSTTLQQQVTIPQPPTTNTYTLEVDTNIVPQNPGNSLLNFTVKVRDVNGNVVTTLPANTTISFNLQAENILQTTVSNGGNVISNVSIKKNGVTQVISPTITTSQSATAVSTCPPNQSTLISSGITKQYNGISISGSDSITGTIQVQVNKTAAVGNVCILKSLDTVRLINKQITGCSCCNISNTASTSTQMQTNAVK